MATAPELEGVSGKYYDIDREIPYAENATEAGLGEALWVYTEKIAAAESTAA